MDPKPSKVVSLLPAATEIVAALGATERLAAVSHDCDFPPEIAALPRITRCEIHGRDLPSAEVDRWVRETLAERGTLYTIDDALLRELAPDVILTQQLCDVCAPSYGSVAQLAATLEPPPRLVNLEPERLEEVWANVREVGAAIGLQIEGERLAAGLERRVAEVSVRAAGAPSRPTCVLIEWLEPLFRGGHWNPELVALAGAHDPLGRPGEPSTEVAWSELVAAAPEVLVISACGNGVETTLAELPALAAHPGWRDLPAVRGGRVFVVDGSAYFSRPGPRLVDSLEILAGIVHPELFPAWAQERRSADRVVRVGAEVAPT